MPFQIIQNDIVNMKVDAIVNTANPKPMIGMGVDTAIHQKAGPRLLAARKEIGRIKAGETAVTPGYGLDAAYVIHTVGPFWMDGRHDESYLLRRCYENALQAALDHDCKSIAFPLLSTGNYRFPKPLALQIAINAFSGFLMRHEMQIYLILFTKDAVELSERLFQSIESYIDEIYIQEKTREEYGEFWDGTVSEWNADSRSRIEVKSDLPGGLRRMLQDTSAGFSETLLERIRQSGKKESEIYKRVNIDRKLFSKIRTNKEYRPSKSTVLAFAIALELDINDTKDLLARAGYALIPGNKFDIIVEYFIRERNYDMFALNEVLLDYDLPLLGI